MKKIIHLVFVTLLLSSVMVVHAESACDPSQGLGPTLIFIGHVVRIAKILIPIIIIGFGAIDFFHSVVGDKPEEMKKSAMSLLWRLIAGIVIFFLPAIVSLIFSWVEGWNQYEDSYEECFKCVWDVGSCKK